MAITQYNGGTQIKAGTITADRFAANLGLALNQLAEGAELLKRDGSVAMTGDLKANGFKVVGLADGVAATDAVTKGQLDAVIHGLPNPMEYKGLFDASAGALPAAGDNGDMYIVSVAGTISGTKYEKGVAIVFKPTAAKTGGTVVADWDILDRQDQVLTVAGKMGNVVLTLADITDVTVLASEVNQLSGVKGNVQAAIDAKFDAAKVVNDATFAAPTVDTVATSAAVKSYVDAQSLATKTAAEADAKAYTDAREAAILTSMGTSGTQALADAKTYTDAQLVAKLPVFVDDEVATGVCDGTNVTFTLVGTPVVGSLKLYYNGQRLHAGTGNDFTYTDKTITLDPVHAPQAGEILVADYRTN